MFAALHVVPVRTRFAVCIDALCKPVDHAFTFELVDERGGAK